MSFKASCLFISGVHFSEAAHSQSKPTADLNTSCYQLVTNSHPSHCLSMTGKCQSNDARPASANAPSMLTSRHEAVTEMAISKSSLDARRDAIRQQMVELNRQRLLAQAKVDELRQQEQQFTQQVLAALDTYMQSRYQDLTIGLEFKALMSGLEIKTKTVHLDLDRTKSLPSALSGGIINVDGMNLAIM